MAPKLYMTETSPGVRSVLLTAKALDVDLERIYINIFAGEHLTPEFLKLNPQHTLPTFLDENGKVLWDSHAIMVYLVEKYGKDNSLYPVDPYQRAVINQRLHFNSGSLFPPLRMATVNLFYKGAKTIAPHIIGAMEEALEILETFLEGHRWVAGDRVTLADLSIIPTVTTIDLAVPVNMKTYPNIAAWIKRAETLSYYKEHVPGQKLSKKLFESRGCFIKPLQSYTNGFEEN